MSIVLFVLLCYRKEERLHCTTPWGQLTTPRCTWLTSLSRTGIEHLLMITKNWEDTLLAMLWLSIFCILQWMILSIRFLRLCPHLSGSHLLFCSITVIMKSLMVNQDVFLMCFFLGWQVFMYKLQNFWRDYYAENRVI